ncbi:hypothetical protein [Natronoglycomyces albus]|uniref:Uncharacterized protein n=1 Tax=Natronoglycomyces albus TaxID=2811108 RepID=A0A895XPP8_9ACTN|nr:hypothetical protein [Natronoglycomyces albus]QSB05075.1 hypothetical protein JQS30_15150 [Natronoglycomyces albus]
MVGEEFSLWVRGTIVFFFYNLFLVGSMLMGLQLGYAYIETELDATILLTTLLAVASYAGIVTVPIAIFVLLPFSRVGSSDIGQKARMVFRLTAYCAAVTLYWIAPRLLMFSSVIETAIVSSLGAIIVLFVLEKRQNKRSKHIHGS